MPSTNYQEDIHISFISALCASADISYDTQRHDDDSADGIIKKRIIRPDGSFYDAQLRIQLKSTSSPSQYSENDDIITYKLKAKNYNDLCTPATTPIILGLLILPDDMNEWVQWSPDDLLIKGRMYWLDLSSNKTTDNQSTVSVKIPKANTVNQAFLLETLEKISKEDWP